MENFVQMIEGSYKNVKATENREDRDEMLNAIHNSGGRCPCNKKRICGSCNQLDLIESDKIQKCGCGLFVRRVGA